MTLVNDIYFAANTEKNLWFFNTRITIIYLIDMNIDPLKHSRMFQYSSKDCMQVKGIKN